MAASAGALAQRCAITWPGCQDSWCTAQAARLRMAARALFPGSTRCIPWDLGHSFGPNSQTPRPGPGGLEGWDPLRSHCKQCGGRIASFPRLGLVSSLTVHGCEPRLGAVPHLAVFMLHSCPLHLSSLCCFAPWPCPPPSPLFPRHILHQYASRAGQDPDAALSAGRFPVLRAVDWGKSWLLTVSLYLGLYAVTCNRTSFGLIACNACARLLETLCHPLGCIKGEGPAFSVRLSYACAR